MVFWEYIKVIQRKGEEKGFFEEVMIKLRSVGESRRKQVEKRGRTELSGRRNSKCDIGWSSGPMNSHQSALLQRYPRGIISIRDQVETLPPALGRDGQISALSNPRETPATHGVVPSVGSWQQDSPGLREPYSVRFLLFRTTTDPQNNSPEEPQRVHLGQGL